MLIRWPASSGEGRGTSVLAHRCQCVIARLEPLWAARSQWSSLWRRAQGKPTLVTWLSDWPVERPRDWVARVNRLHTGTELEAFRVSMQRGRPFGDERWVRRLAKRFGLEATLRPRGRPKGS